VGKYHDEYTKYDLKWNAIRETADKKVEEIQRAIPDEPGNEAEKGNVVRALVDQLASATRVIAWSHVHLFCARFEQVGALPQDRQISETDPPLTPHQSIFKFALALLSGKVAEVEALMSKLADSKAQIRMADCVNWTRCLLQYKDALLRQCDAHFKTPTEWTIPRSSQ
jgi:hypothetical protein